MIHLAHFVRPEEERSEAVEKQLVRRLRRAGGPDRCCGFGAKYRLNPDGQVRVADAVPESVVAVVAVLELAVAGGVDRLEHGPHLQQEAAVPDQGRVAGRHRLELRARRRARRSSLLRRDGSGGGGGLGARARVVAGVRPDRRGGPKHRRRSIYLKDSVATN